MATPGEVLDDLDSFLDLVSEGEDEGRGENDGEGTLFYAGDACHKCRVTGCPPMTALLAGHVGCLREILSANDEDTLSSVRSGNGATLAHVAARKGDAEALKLVLECTSGLVKVGDVRGATPLHVCAYHGHEEGLSSLLEAGAEADQPDLDGATAVHFAAASGHLQSLKILVERGGGDANARCSGGETPGTLCVCVCASLKSWSYVRSRLFSVFRSSGRPLGVSSLAGGASAGRPTAGVDGRDDTAPCSCPDRQTEHHPLASPLCKLSHHVQDIRRRHTRTLCCS